MSAWASEGLFQVEGGIVDFFRWWPKAFFQGSANNSENSFYQIKTNKKTVFYKNMNRRVLNFEIYRAKPPLHVPLLTPMNIGLASDTLMEQTNQTRPV